MVIPTLLLHLAERSSELFFMYNLKSQRFTYMNPRCLTFFNLESIEVDSSLLLNAIHPEDHKYVLSKLNDCIGGQIVADVECRIRRAEHERWLRITPFMFDENGERILIGQAEDITPYKANIETLTNHNMKKNSILTILAHDLAGPIGTINNLATVLGMETAQFENQEVDRYIGMISKISKSSTKLIHDFLSQEFLESSAAELLKTRVELTSKIKLATEKYFALQKELDIQFSCNSNKDSIYVAIDEDKFMQVINNLISNSLKFTPDGGRIDINVDENQENIIISVSDSGIGIPKRYHAKLFDKFTPARRSGLKGEHSIGLGMSIIHTIVKWHNGDIWFESEENKGTTFYIQLPKA